MFLKIPVDLFLIVISLLISLILFLNMLLSTFRLRILIPWEDAEIMSYWDRIVKIALPSCLLESLIILLQGTFSEHFQNCLHMEESTPNSPRFNWDTFILLNATLKRNSEVSYSPFHLIKKI